MIIRLPHIQLKRSHKIIIAVVFGLLILATLWTVAFHYYFKAKTYPNVQFLGNQVGGLTSEQLAQKIDPVISEKNALSVTFQDGDKNLAIPLKDTGISFDRNLTTDTIWQTKRSSKIISRIISAYNPEKSSIEPVVATNEEVYSIFKELLAKQFNIPVMDAYLKVEADAVVIVPEVTGKSFTEAVKNQIINSVLNKSNPPVILSFTEQIPQIKSPDLEPIKLTAKDMINKKITVDYDGKAIALGSADIGMWLSFTREGTTVTPVYDDTKIKASITTIAKNNDLGVQDRRIDAITGEVISGGQTGKTLDQTDLFNQIKGQLSTVSTFSVKGKITKTPPQTKGRYDGKYIDVKKSMGLLLYQLSDRPTPCDYSYELYQPGFYVMGDKDNNCALGHSVNNTTKVWMVDGAKVVGGPFEATLLDTTPTGEFHINSKAPNQMSSIWHINMQWWQHFWDGYGFHVGYGASGGCITMHEPDAKALYDFTSIGTTVNIHYASSNTIDYKTTKITEDYENGKVSSDVYLSARIIKVTIAELKKLFPNDAEVQNFK